MNEIRRRFVDLTDDEIEDVEQLAQLRDMGWRKPLYWDELLLSQRILLLSEAQAGKTFECQRQQERLWNDGEAAFYVELAAAGAQPWRDLRSPEQNERFERWKRNDGETLTIFIDSIDELNLTQASFATALRNVANDLEGNFSRVRTVLTSRPLRVDRDTFAQLFPIPDVTPPPDENDFARLAMGIRLPKSEFGDQTGPAPVREVALVPLSAEEVAEIAASLGVAKPGDFVEALRASSMLDFVKRPQDVIEQVSAWQALDGCFGTHAQQVAIDIENRLRGNAERPRERQLSPQKAWEGAARLALAAALTRRLSIRHNVKADIGEPGTAIEPATILADWSDDERKALLERPLFGFASYGRVRFHNRLAVEFLAADRLDALINRGLSFRTVRRLLFARTAQAIPVVRPSMRDTAAWLALRQAWVFDTLCMTEPSILLDLGDPGSLSIEQRKRALRAYAEKYGTGGWRGLHVPRLQVHRFAHLDLAPLINDLFPRIENSEVRQLLLEIVEAAALAECAKIARATVNGDSADVWERFYALTALIAVDDTSLPAIVERIVGNEEKWPPKLVRLALQRLFPRQMTARHFIDLLAWLPETESVGERLAGNLPPLIESADLPAAQLEELREGLHGLVELGLRFDKPLHHVVNDRPQLVPALTMVCKLQAAQPTDEWATSVALVRALRHSRRDSIDAPMGFGEMLGEVGSTARQAVFRADVAQGRRLRPDEDRHGVALEVMFHGALKLGVGDISWMKRLLGDPSATPDERQALLEEAMYSLSPATESERAEHLRGLLPLVAGDAELTELVEKRLQPSAISREHRRMMLCNERRKRRQQRREAKGLASWIQLKRELEGDPDRVFAPQRAGGTAWNLWRVMERGEERTGWNRPLIERHLGKDIADRLRLALAAQWRGETPTLSSERAAHERNTYWVRWTAWLAGIAAEAEDPEWATEISDDQAELAARYAQLAMNGFPAWLPALAESHATAIERVIGGELTFELDQTASDQSWSPTLSSISHAPPELAALFLPRLRAWLAATRGQPRPQDNPQGAAARLERVLAVLLKFGSHDDRSFIRDIAADGLGKIDEHHDHVWLPVLFALDVETAVTRLETMLAPIAVSHDSGAVGWIGSLFGQRGGGASINVRNPSFTPALLLQLVRLAFRHVEREADAVHEGSYSPDMRDDAENGRGALLGAVLALSGQAGWDAKLAIAADPQLSHIRDRLHLLALEGAAKEADGGPLNDAQVAALEARQDPGPQNAADMAALLADRLDDVEELLLSDGSPRELWAKIDDEKLLRRELARTLGDRRCGAYVVAQEGVTAEEKEMDLRLVSTASAFAPEAVIELKLGDKGRSATELRDTIRNQLVAKYMAPDSRRVGVLVIALAGDKKWKHPETGEQLEFEGLIAMLSEEAIAVQAEMPGMVFVGVRGLDLRPRLPTEREAAKPPLKADVEHARAVGC